MPRGVIAPFWGSANPLKEVSRDIGYRGDSIAISCDMGPLSLTCDCLQLESSLSGDGGGPAFACMLWGFRALSLREEFVSGKTDPVQFKRGFKEIAFLLVRMGVLQAVCLLSSTGLFRDKIAAKSPGSKPPFRTVFPFLKNPCFAYF